MSKVGKTPINIPENTQVEILSDNTVKVKGPKGQLERKFFPEVKIKKKDNQVIVERTGDSDKQRALHGTARSLLNNMIIGVSEGFQRTLEIVGVGYRANLKGSDLELSVGYSRPIIVKKPEEIEFEVPAPTRIIVKGINKEKVGQVAANIRSVRKPEPYKGKGIRYADEHVRKKAGKTATVTTA